MRPLMSLIVMLALCGGALAHDAKAFVDPDRGAWFDSLKTPVGGSCCNVNDCKQTRAEWRGDRWWVVVRGEYGEAWKEIPPEKVLLHPKSIDGEAYVCYSQGDIGPQTVSIYCFIPPLMGL